MPTPGVTTLATVTLQAQQRADMVGSSFVSASEWTSYINASYQELYGLLVQKFGADYFLASPYTFTTDGTNYLFSLPSDFFKLQGVDALVGNKWTSLRPFAFSERNRNSAQSSIPQSGIQCRILYTPRLTLLANPTDTLDGVDGWEEYVVCDAAIKANQKEEDDVGVLLAQKKDLLSRINDEADRRDAGSPPTVADVRGVRNGVAAIYGVTGLRYRLAGSSIWLNPDDNAWGVGEV